MLIFNHHSLASSTLLDTYDEVRAAVRRLCIPARGKSYYTRELFARESINSLTIFFRPMNRIGNQTNPPALAPLVDGCPRSHFSVALS